MSSSNQDHNPENMMWHPVAQDPTTSADSHVVFFRPPLLFQHAGQLTPELLFQLKFKTSPSCYYCKFKIIDYLHLNQHEHCAIKPVSFVPSTTELFIIGYIIRSPSIPCDKRLKYLNGVIQNQVPRVDQN